MGNKLMVSRVREGVCVGGDKREMDVVTKEQHKGFWWW